MALISKFDNGLTNYVKKLPTAAHPFLAAITLLGGPIAVVSVALFSTLVAWRQDERQTTLAFLAAILALGANGIMKMFLHRTRPDNLYVTHMRFKSYSFPSGHAFGGLLIYGLLTYLAFWHFSSPINYLLLVLANLLIFLIGLSRIYLGAHYPSDVLGGWLLAAGSLYLIIRFVLPL